MPIPGFENDGLLPLGTFAGPHWVFDEAGQGTAIETYSGWATDQAEVYEHLVERFAGTTTRHALYAELDRYVESVTARVPCALFLLSGEFVTDEVDALDVHLVVVLLHDAMADLEPLVLWELNRMLDHREAVFGERTKCRVTLEMGRVYPHGHSRYAETLDQLARLRATCSEPVDVTLGGYLQFTVCPEGGEPHEILGFLANAVTAS